MSRLWANDEELAKKDDDLNAPRHGRNGSNHIPLHGQWQSAVRTPRRSSVTRLVLILGIVSLLIFAFSRRFGAPSTQGLGDRILEKAASSPSSGSLEDLAQSLPAGTNEYPTVDHKKTATGPVKLGNLGRSLQSIAATQGKQQRNRNVLFAAASLQSAATLLPIACQMAYEKKNYVHFALMGRSDISMQQLLKVNGIDEECPLIIHDARPDHGSTSPWARMKSATFQAMYHVNHYMHPQAIMVDASLDEEAFFLSGLRDQVRYTKSALVELPYRPTPALSWITKLDSASLAAWDKIHLDILIQAPPSGAGNLKRLLTSLSKLDLGTRPIPHLTVELPQNVDRQVEGVLADFQWPPPGALVGDQRGDMLSLRRRIPRKKLTAEESSIRFLESYWPRNPSHSYVLVLSPHTEVNPQFLHYVKYTILHYRHSNAAFLQDWGENMMGMSLTSPSILLDGSQSLNSPEPGADFGGAFLWQAPNSDAMIFPGDKWMELHGFISQVFERQDSLSETPALLAHKDVSKMYPSWLEYALQLSKARGYYTVYPGKETAGAILGSHNDIPDVPGEYEDDDEAKIAAEGEGLEDQATDSFDALWTVNILETLPLGGTLPFATTVPVLTWDGKPTSIEDLHVDSVLFAAQFRAEVGSCEVESEAPNRRHKYAEDLFCSSSTQESESDSEAI